MPKIFVSDADTRSFLTPALQFPKREQAIAYAAERGWDTCDDAFQLFTVGDSSFQPRAFNTFDACVVADTDRRSRVRTETLRRTSESMPANARHTCLLTSGPRTYYRYIHQTSKRSPAYYRFASGEFECFAAWGRQGEYSLGEPLFTEGAQRVYVGRSGRGAIYASHPNFDDDLRIVDYTIHLALVSFRILDRDDRKDDLLRVELDTRGRYHGAFGDTVELDPNSFDDHWRQLAAEARSGFLEYCQAPPKRIATELEAFRRQVRLSEEDRRKPLSASYYNRVTQLDWERALDTVEEAWQLEIVIYEHCDHEFSNSPQYQDARYVRVRNMFKRYARPQSRMDELNAMISSFVAPRDRLWDYVGD